MTVPFCFFLMHQDPRTVTEDVIIRTKIHGVLGQTAGLLASACILFRHSSRHWL